MRSCLLSGGCNPNGKDWVELSLFLGNKMGIIQILGAFFFFGRGVTANVSPASPYIFWN